MGLQLYTSRIELELAENERFSATCSQTKVYGCLGLAEGCTGLAYFGLSSQVILLQTSCTCRSRVRVRLFNS